MQQTEFSRLGLWLFRRRSYLAFAALPLAVVGLRSFTFIARSHQLTEWWQALCFGVSISGLALRALTVGFVPCGTSSRNTREPIAPVLNTTGAYSLVRHPLYIGNYLAALGCLMFFHCFWIVLAGTAVFGFLYEPIILSEESFLKDRFGVNYARWAATTSPWIPRMRGWNPPALPFSWRTVFSREYTGFFVVCALFFLFDLIGDRVAAGRWWFDGWSIVLVFGVLIYLIFRTLKRRTRLLDVDGR